MKPQASPGCQSYWMMSQLPGRGRVVWCMEIPGKSKFKTQQLIRRSLKWMELNDINLNELVRFFKMLMGTPDTREDGTVFQ